VAETGLAGLRVISFESRRAADVQKFIRQMGAEPLVAPSMREVPLEDQADALYFGERLLSGRVDVLILLTGVGTRALVQALCSRHSREAILQALIRIKLVARGPKPIVALNELGLKPTLSVPEPNTWHEVLSSLDAQLPLKGLTVAVQEYGSSNEELLRGLKSRAAEVIRVPIYRWALPEDLEPLRRAVKAVCQNQADVLLFTSSAQVQHVIQVAEMMGFVDDFLAGTRRCVIASVGPICTEELQRRGIEVDVQPAHPHMGPLLQEVGQKSPSLLRAKRG
jgi:uroporphyrinogen-III synthase